MKVIDQVKSGQPYYLAMKVTMAAIIFGLVCFFLTWVGIWLKMDMVRHGGMVLFALSIAVGCCSYIFLLSYIGYVMLKKIFKSAKS